MSRTAPRASSRASSGAWRAWASSDSFPDRLCSKVSLFFTASWSSRSASMTLGSCFLRRAYSAAAFFSAKATTFFNASISAFAPRARNIYTFIRHTYFIVLKLYKVSIYLGGPRTASSPDQVLLRPAPDSALVRRHPQHERWRPATTPAYSHRHILIRLLRMLFDPLFDLSFQTPNRASGATVYTVIFSHYFITYLKAC